MLSRRLFGGCALCAGLALIADDATAQMPGFSRAVLSKVTLPDSIYDVVQIMVTIQPNALIARHTHPGTESSVVLEGASTLSVKDMPERRIGAGESFLIAPDVPHAVRNLSAVSRVLATYTVDRSKPLASPAPE